MTPTDTAALARYIRAHFPQQPIDEYTSEALHELLARFPAADAREAVLRIAGRGEHWCAPTAIAAEVKRIRRDRIEKHPPLVPPPGLDDSTERAWIAAARSRIGDGEVIDCDAAYELVGSPGLPRMLATVATATDPDPTPAAPEPTRHEKETRA